LCHKSRFLAQIFTPDKSNTGLCHKSAPKVRHDVVMPVPEPLLEAIKNEAGRSGIPYQRFIRQALENAVHHPQAH
jgi:predicted DNA binding CopG/RHH family protein